MSRIVSGMNAEVGGALGNVAMAAFASMQHASNVRKLGQARQAAHNAATCAEVYRMTNEQLIATIRKQAGEIAALRSQVSKLEGADDLDALLDS